MKFLVRARDAEDGATLREGEFYGDDEGEACDAAEDAWADRLDDWYSRGVDFELDAEEIAE